MKTQNKIILEIIKFSQELIKKVNKKTSIVKLKPSDFVFHSKDNCKKRILVLLNAKDNRIYEYINTAIHKGVAGIISDYNINANKLNSKIPILISKKLPLALNSFLSFLYNDPLMNKHIIGVTGTDGKTSLSHLLAQSLTYLGRSVGIISSEGNGIYPHLKKNMYTTSPAHILFEYFHEFTKKNVDIIVIECSSQGLDQNRLNNIKFHESIVTNITNDHLDYHKTLTRYMMSKAKLLKMTSNKIYLNKACSSTKRIIKMFKTKAQVIYYGLDDRICFKTLNLQENIPTRYNLSLIKLVLKNMLFNESRIYEVFKKLKPIIGRNNYFVTEKNINFYVDYAHTSNSFQSLLEGVKNRHRGSAFNIIVVFGCGGDRDIAKRSLMGRIAEKYSSMIILTDDNPRNENPEKIINDISLGIEDQSKIIIISNRKEAIKKAITIAQKNDVIVLAGKGNEDDIIYDTNVIKHNDLKYLRSLLK